MRRPDPPEDLARIATNSFILWSSWIRFLTSSRAKLDIDPVDVVDGALQSFLTFAPYLEPGFAEEVRAVFDERAAQVPPGFLNEALLGPRTSRPYHDADRRRNGAHRLAASPVRSAQVRPCPRAPLPARIP